jgi:CRP/FNR family transcriptional regulator, cyclic AMP receptor protein
MTRQHRVAATARGRGLFSLNVEHTSSTFEPDATIFAQGDRAATVMYVEDGCVRLTVKSPYGRKAVVAVLATGGLFGEGVLAGQRRRTATAQSVTTARIGIVKTADMRRRLQEGSALSKWFRSQVLAANIRMEEALVRQVFNHCERRLARALLLLAHFDEHQAPSAPLPIISRNVLAEMTGATRSQVDLFMNRFRQLGFLVRHSGRDRGLHVHRSMLSVVLQD